jgi:NAD(P)-dependent dehydrogenase (short-subunit alcohol dehydrogenase family)
MIRLVKSVLPIMRQQGSGQIVNISGPAGIVPVPFMGLFSASKAALEGYTLALRHEVKRLNIRVSLVLPGPIRTQVMQYSQRATQHLKAYTQWEDSFVAWWQNGYAVADDPALVAEKVWGILNSRAPKAHYTVGKGIDTFLLMRRLMPEALFEAGIRRLLDLDADAVGTTSVQSNENALRT